MCVLMSRGYGSIDLTVTCPVCEQEVTFVFEWDRSVGHECVHDTEHDLPNGRTCELPEGTVDKAIEEATTGIAGDDCDAAYEAMRDREMGL